MMQWTIFLASLLALCVAGSSGCTLGRRTDLDSSWFSKSESLGRRSSREVTLDERNLCQPGDVQPAIRVNTTERVASLREKMNTYNLDAYVVPTDDEHQSEYVAPADERRRYICGFSGSSGTAVVLLKEEQALWTDGRYFLEAEDELDCSWLLMKQRNEGVPSLIDWLKQKLPSGSRVGADPRLIGAQTWISYMDDLAKSGIVLVAEEDNLIDLIWSTAEGRPEYPSDPVFIHELQFAGRRWEDKVAVARSEMLAKEADLFVITALDEVAWLLNLRGNDIPYTPVFRGYVIIGKTFVNLYIDLDKITPQVDNHLNVNQCDTECVSLLAYTSILDSLGGLSQASEIVKVMLGSRYSYSGGASYAVYLSVEAEKRLMATSPVLLTKARKNIVEIIGMKNAHVKDSIALIDFLAVLEKEIADGHDWDEISAANLLATYRAQQEYFMGLSFTTISAFGSNGAIIHYSPVNETNKKITDQSLYLLDSGGQYKDGTTDVTRTMHYGTPTEYQREAYTRVLMGAIDMASLIFPEGTEDVDIDILARRALYEVGLDYRHGTSHGIGMFLGVHESFNPSYVEGFHGSDEPGYYKDGNFGIRLETILRVVIKNTTYHFDKQMLGFEPITLVPFETKLINVSLLNAAQCGWVNSYHESIRSVVGPVMLDQGRINGHAWMNTKTEPLDCTGGGLAKDATLLLTTESTAALAINEVNVKKTNSVRETNGASATLSSLCVLLLCLASSFHHISLC